MAVFSEFSSPKIFYKISLCRTAYARHRFVFDSTLVKTCRRVATQAALSAQRSAVTHFNGRRAGDDFLKRGHAFGHTQCTGQTQWVHAAFDCLAAQG